MREILLILGNDALMAGLFLLWQRFKPVAKASETFSAPVSEVVSEKALAKTISEPVLCERKNVQIRRVKR